MNSTERDRLAECERRLTALAIMVDELREEVQEALDRIEELE